MDIRPIEYARKNTDPTIVISTVVAVFAVGATVTLLRKSGVPALENVAKIAKR